jgi:hypothetical protein
MLRAENGPSLPPSPFPPPSLIPPSLLLFSEWNPHFAFQGRGSLKQQNSSAGLEASDNKWNEAVRSSQFSSVAMPSYRTHTIQFDNALGGRGEYGVGRNWTGKSVGAKGLRHDLQQDALRTTLLLRELSSDCYQVCTSFPHSLCLSLPLSPSLSVSLSLCLSLPLSPSLSVSLPLSPSLSLLPIYVSICPLSVCLCLCSLS